MAGVGWEVERVGVYRRTYRTEPAEAVTPPRARISCESDPSRHHIGEVVGLSEEPTDREKSEFGWRIVVGDDSMIRAFLQGRGYSVRHGDGKINGPDGKIVEGGYDRLQEQVRNMFPENKLPTGQHELWAYSHTPLGHMGMEDRRRAAKTLARLLAGLGTDSSLVQPKKKLSVIGYNGVVGV